MDHTALTHGGWKEACGQLNPRRRSSLALCALCALCLPRLAEAEETPTSPKRTVAAVFLVTEDVGSAATAVVREAFKREEDRIPTLEVATDAALWRLLRQGGESSMPQAAVVRCGPDLACIAELGRKSGASEVLLVRLSQDPETGLVLQAITVGAQDETIVRKMKIEAQDETALAQDLSTKATQILGVTAEEEAAASALAAQEAEKAAAATAAAEATAADGTSVASEGKGPIPWWADDEITFWTGVGAAGTGAALLFLGTSYGIYSSSRRGSIKPETSQSAVEKRQDQANSAAHKANVLFAVGGTLAGLGAGVLGWHFLGGDLRSSLALAVEPGDDRWVAAWRTSW